MKFFVCTSRTKLFAVLCGPIFLLYVRAWLCGGSDWNHWVIGLLNFSLVSLVFGAYFLWIFSIGRYIGRSGTVNLGWKYQFFRIAIGYSISYAIASSYFRYVQASEYQFSTLNQILSTLFFAFTLYALCFDVLAILREDRKSSREAFFVYLFCLWFFPVGLWIVQEKVNGAGVGNNQEGAKKFESCENADRD